MLGLFLLKISKEKRKINLNLDSNQRDRVKNLVQTKTKVNILIFIKNKLFFLNTIKKIFFKENSLINFILNNYYIMI